MPIFVLRFNPVYLQVLDENPHTFTISVKTENFGKTEGLGILIRFTLPKNYPDDPPEMFFEEDNLEEEMREMTMKKLDQVVKENLGLPMVFAIVTEAIEVLKEKNEEIVGEVKKRRELERKEKLDMKKINLKSFVSLKTDLGDESDSDDPDWRP